MSWSKRVRWTASIAALCLAVSSVFAVACGDDDDEETPTATTPTTASTATTAAATTAATTAAATNTPTPEPLEGEILIFAAASLTDAFTAMAEEFNTLHPDVMVTFNFASSSALATQINEGAPADVFASADNNQMKVVTDAGGATGPQQFATNLPVVIVPAGSDAVASFADLAKPGIRLVLAAPEVPIGRYSREIFTKASAGALGATFSETVLANLVSNEANVRAVLTKVQLDEADAGVVYSTDATVGGEDVEAIEIPAEYNVIAQYPIVALTEAPNAEVAAAWVAFVLSDEGQAILESFGFGPAS